MILQTVDLKFTNLFLEVELVELPKASAQISTLDGDLKVKTGDLPLNLGEDKDKQEEEEKGMQLAIGTTGKPKIDGILMLGVI